MSINVPANQLCTPSLAHWQGIVLVDGDMDEEKRTRRAGEKGRGSVVLETLNRKRDGPMTEGKKLQNVGQWQQEAVASEHGPLPFGALIASMRLFACLSVGQRALRACQGWLGDPVEGEVSSSTDTEFHFFRPYQQHELKVILNVEKTSQSRLGSTVHIQGYSRPFQAC